MAVKKSKSTSKHELAKVAPVDPIKIANNRKRFLESEAGKLILQSQSIDNRSLTKQVQSRPTAPSASSTPASVNSNRPKPARLMTWEDLKQCRDNEDLWNDGAYGSGAKGICRNACLYLRECLIKDRQLGAQPGIRAGLTQAERVKAYEVQDKIDEVAGQEGNSHYLYRLADLTLAARALQSLARSLPDNT